MDNVGIVVESLDAAISFFAELGLELEGRATIEGDWAERVTGLRHMRVEIAMMRTPDGHSRLEISRFLTPPAVADHRNAPVNALGYLRIMFAWRTSTIRSPGSARTEPSWLVNWRSTRISIGSVTSEALRGSSSGWPSRSASGLNFRDGRAPQASFPNAGPHELPASSGTNEARTRLL